MHEINLKFKLNSKIENKRKNKIKSKGNFTCILGPLLHSTTQARPTIRFFALNRTAHPTPSIHGHCLADLLRQPLVSRLVALECGPHLVVFHPTRAQTFGPHSPDSTLRRHTQSLYRGPSLPAIPLPRRFIYVWASVVIFSFSSSSTECNNLSSPTQP
jgi:hypothetical protein